MEAGRVKQSGFLPAQKVTLLPLNIRPQAYRLDLRLCRSFGRGNFLAKPVGTRSPVDRNIADKTDHQEQLINLASKPGSWLLECSEYFEVVRVKHNGFKLFLAAPVVGKEAAGLATKSCDCGAHLHVGIIGILR